ncbi:MAG: efflux RND transporter periplasmic adaptor subunit, partial [Planctomycetes bacterium]|nr:efflux RND transporter periplasmic adaptor subunit [Planctomycetota bacterium]
NMALDRVTRKAAADLVQAEAELKAKELEYKNQQSKLAKVQQQIDNCVILAPVGGMVVYATTGRGHWRRNVEPLDEGQDVREREELIYLPTTSSMIAEVKVHESSLRKIREGLPVRVHVEALPDRQFIGRVGKIGLLPDAQSAFLNPDLKVYATQIYIEQDAGDLRVGMTCRADIIVAEYADAIYVPVQSVTRVGTQHMVYVMGSDSVEARDVKVGLDNNRMIRILEGLSEGEKVLLNPPLAPSEAAQPPPMILQDLPASTTQPAPVGDDSATSQPTSRPSFDRSKLRSMSPDQRRKFIETLTPEQREQLRSRQGGTGRRRRDRQQQQ